MTNYIIKINGCHFSDAMRRYTLNEMKAFLKSKDYDIVTNGDGISEYNYVANYIDSQKTFVLFDEDGKLIDIEYEGLP